MMEKLKEMIAYFTKYYPRSNELSNARLTKMVYLADWHQAINYGTQISSINWYFDNYGPFVHEIADVAEDHPDIFEKKVISNFYENKKTIINLKNSSYEPKLSERERQSLDHIINITQRLNWNDFIQLVYSTYPVASSARYSSLDLVNKAKEYKKQQK